MTDTAASDECFDVAALLAFRCGIFCFRHWIGEERDEKIQLAQLGVGA